MIDNTENSQRKNKIEDTEQSACTLCPRDCKKNRADGEIGVCGETAAMRIGRAALHMWEEPCISGEKGSGAVFFTGCPLHCVYCQNYAISDGGTIFSTYRTADRKRNSESCAIPMRFAISSAIRNPIPEISSANLYGLPRRIS